jgi:hypothetical protein
MSATPSWSLWFIRFISFVWLNQTDQIDQMNQINPRSLRLSCPPRLSQAAALD